MSRQTALTLGVLLLLPACAADQPTAAPRVASPATHAAAPSASSTGRPDALTSRSPGPGPTPVVVPAAPPVPAWPGRAAPGRAAPGRPAPGAAGPDRPAEPGSRLWGRTFTAASYEQDGRDRPFVAGTRLTVRFSREQTDGLVVWWSGCNTAGGPVVVRATSLDVREPVTSSAAGCSKEREEQDDLVTRFLRSDPAWDLRDALLELRSGSIVLRLVEGPASPAPDGPRATTPSPAPTTPQESGRPSLVPGQPLPPA